MNFSNKQTNKQTKHKMLIKSISIISFLFLIGITSLTAQTTLVDPEWEFFDNFEGTINNSFWQGSGTYVNYGVNRPDATSKVLEMTYIPNSEGGGDSWSEYDFNLGIDAVQVEVSFKMFTPSDYVPIENNHKLFYLYSGAYGHANANIVVNSEGWGSTSGARPSINVGVDGFNMGHSMNPAQLSVWKPNEGKWSTIHIFLSLATKAGNFGYYEIFKDGVLLTSTSLDLTKGWAHGIPANEQIYYSTSGNFIDKGTLLGWANGATGGGFLVDTKFLIDDFRIRANATFGTTTLSVNDETLNTAISITPNPTSNTFIIDLGNEILEKVIIYNNLGQQVKKVTTNEVNISNLSNGVYFVKITSQSGKTVTEKIVKN
ncbi:MAG: T9SS type A sorting domain-containing protein [Flavobacteriaceae bacterium]|nr:T9SS type A sorting domain-containing protein [Flavobacteriaceae bacterium]